MIRRLSSEGVAVVYISHRMEEVFALAHRITVLRDGRLIGTLAAREANRREVIRMHQPEIKVESLPAVGRNQVLKRAICGVEMRQLFCLGQCGERPFTLIDRELCYFLP